MKYFVILFGFLVLIGVAGIQGSYAYPVHDLDYENSPYQNKKTPSLGKPIDLFFQIGNYGPTPQNSHAIVTITNIDEHKQVYYNEYTQVISSGNTIDIRWDFTPQTSGLYLVDVMENSNQHSKYFFAVPENNDQKRMPKTNPELLYDTSPRKQFRMGIDPKLIICKEGLFLALKTFNMPVCLTLDTLVELRYRDFVVAEVIDYEKIGHTRSENQFVTMLKEKNIEYDKENFLLVSGFSLDSLPPSISYCGYVLDNKQEEYWFSSSYNFPTLGNSELVDNNPHPCKSNSYSCECSLQTQLAEKNQKELSYFTTFEEDAVGKSVSDYLNRTKIANVSNQFIVGKYNLESESSDIHYCGKFTWTSGLKHFEGYIKNGDVTDFSLAVEQPKLCAIDDNSRIFTFDKSSIVPDVSVNPLQMAKRFLLDHLTELRITAMSINNSESVLEITIHDEELKRIPNAKEFYENKIKQMLPFDVPIKIEFGHPVLEG